MRLDAVMLGRRCDGGVRLGVRAHPEREERHEGDSPLGAHVQDLLGGFDFCVSHPRHGATSARHAVEVLHGDDRRAREREL
jgi:hypothetical protein